MTYEVKHEITFKHPSVLLDNLLELNIEIWQLKSPKITSYLHS
jgi:hypothetical protein